MSVNNLKKCIISRYDNTILEPPFKTIKVDEVEIYEPEKDHLGEKLYKELWVACFNKGYLFKFYTKSNIDGFDYEIVVH